MRKTTTTRNWPRRTAARHRRLLATLILLCLGRMGRAELPFKLVPLHSAEAAAAQASLDKSLLPHGASHVNVITAQSFLLQSTGSAAVTLLPVTFSTSEPGLVKEIQRHTDLCGMYLVYPGETAHFEALPADDTAGLVQCSGLEGMGLARTSGTHAQILMLFRMHTVRRSWSEPFAVSWSDNDGRYVLERLSPPAGMHPAQKLTIAQLRLWVAAKP